MTPIPDYDDRACPVCGGTIPRRQGDSPWQFSRRKFCSRSCGTQARNKRYEVPLDTRLMKQVRTDPATGCWNWTGPTSADGYGLITVQGHKSTTHRTAYTLWRGTIPEGQHVCHQCDNRRCINPDHLFLGTNTDNTADRNAKGRQARGERSGRAVLTERDVRFIRSSSDSLVALAARFGVAESTIHHAKNRTSWAHVED